jgi:hypothetical protein
MGTVSVEKKERIDGVDGCITLFMYLKMVKTINFVYIEGSENIP